MISRFRATSYIAVSSICIAAALFLRYFRRRQLLAAMSEKNAQIDKWRRQLDQQLCFGRPAMEVRLISSMSEWKDFESEFLAAVDKFKIMGFDCEWLNCDMIAGPGKVALIQIALPNGVCALLRICKIIQCPEDLNNLKPLLRVLASVDILKFGVAVDGDAKKLKKDYDILLQGCVDLRNVATKYYPQIGPKKGLKSLSEQLLSVRMPKNWLFVSSGWEDDQLCSQKIEYAANDACMSLNVALELLIRYLEQQDPRHFVQLCSPHESDQSHSLANLVSLTRSQCQPFIGQKCVQQPQSQDSSRKDGCKGKSAKRSSQPLRKSPLYYNVRLEAMDGQLLCISDLNRANWYLSKGLGTLVCDDPMTVRLNFEPAARPDGDAGQYYMTLKENLCVVCGHKDSFLRKYIVPHEYRKHFPELVRTHQSHDVLLMCLDCHQRANAHDMVLRRELARLCDAPLDVARVRCGKLTGVRSAARALLKDSDKLPEKRVAELTEVLLSHYDVSTLTPELLQDAASLDVKEPVDNYTSHGQKVVEHFLQQNEGVFVLEKLWRQHFLDTMKPQFLPTLWSLDHDRNKFPSLAPQ